MLLTIMFLFSTNVFADNWLCTQEASQRRGDSIYSCGLGEGRDEDTARSAAFNNAKREFTRVCELSSDCNVKEVVVTPKRTDCSENNGLFTCRRLVVFSNSKKKFKDLQKGMSREEVLGVLGAPTKIEEDVNMPHLGFFGTHGTAFVYKGKACNDTGFQVPECNLGCYTHWETITGGECVVAFDGEKVAYIYNFKY